MKRSVLCAVLMLGMVLSHNDSLFELNIIHYNDFHAHYEEFSPTGSVCNPSADACIGGFARLYSAIMEILEAEPDSLLLNGGDTFQGTIWYNFLRWNVSQHFMNMLPHDAHVLGNHEFDQGVEGLVPYLERLKAPMLGANVNTTLEPTMTPFIKNHVVVERRGRKIGIIGVLVQFFSAPFGKVIMEDELTAINREAAILTEQGVDIIIVLSHIGYDNDLILAPFMSPEIDIIVGAHSHSLLYTGPASGSYSPTGDYPTVVTQANGHQIPIVQASCYTQYLGNIKLLVNDKGIVEYWDGVPIYLGPKVAQDPQILELLEPWQDEVHAVGKEVLGKALVTLKRAPCYHRECNLGSWICDGLMEEAKHYNSSNGWDEVHLCWINSGATREQITKGDVTLESLLMAFPFENYVQVYEIKGQYILEALEYSVGVEPSALGEFHSSVMIQIGGLRVAYNVSEPIGSRVMWAQVRCIECEVPQYSPIDNNATYRVVSPTYIASGGSGFTMILNNKSKVKNLDIDYVMLERYIRRQRVINQKNDGRIQIYY